MNCVRSLKHQRDLSKSKLILAKLFGNLLTDSIVAEDRCVFLFMLDKFSFCNRRMCGNNMEDNDMMIIVKIRLWGSLSSGR